MTTRSINLVAAIASLLAVVSAHASPNNNMPGQSARSGTQSQADLRAEYQGRRSGIMQNRYDMGPTSRWDMQDKYQLERADRPDRQR